ncbi:hypothetical protein Plhal304r1_c008g0030491 [Plasmopara halstedii]
MELVKPIISDHDLIELTKRSILVLLRPPNLDVGHGTAVHNG